MVELSSYRPTAPKPVQSPPPPLPPNSRISENTGPALVAPAASKWCLERADTDPNLLTHRERHFLLSMSEWWHRPSRKQSAWLEASNTGSSERRRRRKPRSRFLTFPLTPPDNAMGDVTPASGGVDTVATSRRDIVRRQRQSHHWTSLALEQLIRTEGLRLCDRCLPRHRFRNSRSRKSRRRSRHDGARRGHRPCSPLAKIRHEAAQHLPGENPPPPPPVVGGAPSPSMCGREITTSSTSQRPSPDHPKSRPRRRRTPGAAPGRHRVRSLHTAAVEAGLAAAEHTDIGSHRAADQAATVGAWRDFCSSSA